MSQNVSRLVAHVSLGSAGTEHRTARFSPRELQHGNVAMADPKRADRKYLRVVLGIFLAAVLATIVVATIQYWADERQPDVTPETSGP